MPDVIEQPTGFWNVAANAVQKMTPMTALICVALGGSYVAFKAVPEGFQSLGMAMHSQQELMNTQTKTITDSHRHMENTLGTKLQAINDELIRNHRAGQ